MCTKPRSDDSLNLFTILKRWPTVFNPKHSQHIIVFNKFYKFAAFEFTGADRALKINCHKEFREGWTAMV